MRERRPLRPNTSHFSHFSSRDMKVSGSNSGVAFLAVVCLVLLGVASGVLPVMGWGPHDIKHVHVGACRETRTMGSFLTLDCACDCTHGLREDSLLQPPGRGV